AGGGPGRRRRRAGAGAGVLPEADRVNAWYEPGTSVVHRTPAGVKFGVLLVLAAAIFVLRSPVWLGALCGVAVVGYPVARVSWQRGWGLLRSLVLLVVVVFALQSWLLGL